MLLKIQEICLGYNTKFWDFLTQKIFRFFNTKFLDLCNTQFLVFLTQSL